MFRFFVIFTINALGLLTLLSCSMQGQMGDMENKTGQMAETTSKMAQDSKEIKSLAGFTYNGLRPVDTQNLRERTYDCIKKAGVLSEKLVCSEAYFYGFEFQNWKNFGDDDQAKLDSLKEMAVKEFFESLKLFFTPNSYWFPWEDKMPLNQHEMDRYAFGANMHRIYPDQKALAAKDGFQPLSMLSIIEEGLTELYKNPARLPSSMPEWMKYVHFFRDDAIDLLKNRITMLAFLPYAMMNNLDRQYTLEVLWDSELGKHLQFWKSDKTIWWNIEINKRNWAELEKYTEMLKHALTTRYFLNSIGLDAIPDNGMTSSLNINDLYKHLRVTGSMESNKEAFVAKQGQVALFQTLGQILIGSQEEFQKVDPNIYLIY